VSLGCRSSLRKRLGTQRALLVGVNSEPAITKAQRQRLERIASWSAVPDATCNFEALTLPHSVSGSGAGAGAGAGGNLPAQVPCGGFTAVLVSEKARLWQAFPAAALAHSAVSLCLWCREVAAQACGND
jgi:hypothetical protein